MKNPKWFISLLFLIMLSVGCKKEAPYIDSLTGNYKVSGVIDLDTTVIRQLTDTTLAIIKVDNSTIQFIQPGCDYSLSPLSFVYNFENDSTISYSSIAEGDHSPNSATLFFHRPLNGSFTYSQQHYCGNSVNSTLSGKKI